MGKAVLLSPPSAVLLKPVPPLINCDAQHDLVFVQDKLQSLSRGFQQFPIQPKFWLHNMLVIICLLCQSVDQSSSCC